MNRVSRALALALALTALAACSPSGKGARPALLDQAIEAYVAGDAATLRTVGGEARTQKKAALALPDIGSACTMEAASARRAVIAASLIEGLDQPKLMSMTDTARYVNFVNVAEGRGVSSGAVELGPECQDHRMLAIGDAGARMMMLKMMITREEAWRRELQAQYGAELQPRLNEAGKLLERNGVDAGQWAPASRAF